MPVNFIETAGLECALWPHLYWTVAMTETYVRSQDARRLKRRRQHDDNDEEMDEMDTAFSGSTRQSAKASFLAKAHSALIGYNCEPRLLQFVYDLWLFTTVGGAKNSAGTGIREALATKPYSPEVWRTYHMALVDAQRQLGWPSLFLTVAPYEWSFPYHCWLEDELAKSLSEKLNIPTAETLHIAHVLSQAVKGLMTGANEGARGSREHIFAGSEGSGRVRYWVARLEFQDGKRKRAAFRQGQHYHGRGTVHVHILVWLDGMKNMALDSKLRADIPGEDEPELRALVVASQLDWTSSGWRQREEKTVVQDPGQMLLLRHPISAFERHCRAYIVDVLAALRCHTDVQASDGRGMVLKYCASYLPKFSSSFAQELLNDQASDFSLARRILAEYHPLQPEMVLQLAAQRHPQFLCPSVIRKFVVPIPWAAEMPLIVRGYMSCPWRREEMNLLEYLRKSGSDGQISCRYRTTHKNSRIEMPLSEWINVVPVDASILAATILYSRSNDQYFGQWLLLHVPFRCLDDLWKPEAALLPDSLRFLGLCLLHRPRFWRNPDHVAYELQQEAKPDLHISNVLSELAARTELVDDYLSGNLVKATTPDPPVYGTTQLPDGPVKLTVEQLHVVRFLRGRVEVALNAKWPEDNSVDAWDRHNLVSCILGPAGSGKTTAVDIVLAEAAARGAHIGVACPTGMLATGYRARHPGLDIDTVHGMFGLHLDELATAEMMRPYDLVVIDEVGQLPTWIFERLMRLWDATDRRTALVFVGDFCQLTGPDGTTARQSFRWAEVRLSTLTEMRRCKCAQLRWKLQLLRSAIPSGRQLRKLLRGHRAGMRVRPGSGWPTAMDIAVILQETPDTTFVTISRRASAYLNRLAIRALFADAEPLGRIPCEPTDNAENFDGPHQTSAEPCMMPLYEGMRVRITRNANKRHGFVNGMGAVVQRLRQSGVQVKTDEGEILLIHPITTETALADGSIRRATVFALRPGYSTTLHKIQGATLSHVTIYMDVPYVRAALYVALSRVRHDADWRFIGSIRRQHCLPAELG
ncbi:unnamed protein product [Symbiodinium sp. CCMP2592]|nr:unnamed protein product [Symbiodinium sp. CCMP2592]